MFKPDLVAIVINVTPREVNELSLQYMKMDLHNHKNLLDLHIKLYVMPCLYRQGLCPAMSLSTGVWILMPIFVVFTR